ncbi:SRPBCC family protein [Nocardia yamanashiensis]|uniref:SRPBCC family protein n=1 Tax=Nocardia yamanashiensis TaxID=209247 RepID=UPI000835BB8A|nr:SRPBCC family protein [Nocardia yamanashiensis]
MSENAFSTGWQLAESIVVAARPEQIFELVTDITRMGEWSPECYGGAWVAGQLGQVGSRFHGFNREGEASWVSESVVIESRPASTFRFSVLSFRPGGPEDDLPWTTGSEIGDMTWGFTIESIGADSLLTQDHSMKFPSPFYRAMLEDLSEEERRASMVERRENLRRSMVSTLELIKKTAESVTLPN